MFKNRYLTFLVLLIAGLVAGTAGVSAQSEMDLLLFEKKRREPKKPIGETRTRKRRQPILTSANR